MTSNIRRNSTPSPSSAMSQHRSGKGAAFHTTMIYSSDDDLPLPSFKLSALTNALLNSENWQQNVASPQQFHDGQNELSTSRIGDSGERQSKFDSSRLFQQHRSSNAIGCGSPESDNRRPRRVVRIKSKAPGSRGTNTSRELQHSPRLSGISVERSQSNRSISGKLVTPSPGFYSSKPEGARTDSSVSRSKETGTFGSGERSGGNMGSVHNIPTTSVERLAQTEKALQHNTSSVLRTTKSTGTSILGPARRFKRTAYDEMSPGNEMIYASGVGVVEELENDSVIKLEHQSEGHEAVELGVRNSEYAKIVSYICNDMGNVVNLSSSSKSSSSHQRNPPNLPLEHGKENDQSTMVFPPLDQHTHSRPGHKEKQIATPGFSSPQRKPLGVLGINNSHRPPPPPPKISVLMMATKAAGAATASIDRKKRVHITINNNTYQRFECIGRGGSCKVYRVMSENYKVWALKKVSLADVNEQAVKGFKGEVELLRRLEKVDRVVQIRDWEVNETKQTLSVLMEFGEVNLDTILKRRIHGEHAKFDPEFTQFYWKEMLECVAAVHEHDVVHCDLKPANFLLVKGSLKLIDFGIANVIEDDTINVHREHQVGTPNFMAPETLTYANTDTSQPIGEGKLVKLGKPSDIWSLGCILYLMVYGKAPFAQCNGNLQKAMLITNPLHVINYSSTGTGGVCVPSGCIKTLKACLTWDQFQRPAIEALLSKSEQMLHPGFESGTNVAISQEDLGMILQSIVRHCRKSGVPTDSEVAAWPKLFYDKIRSAGAGETD